MLERGVLIVVALLAAGSAGFSLRDARAAYVRELGVQAAARAANMNRGAARDALLDDAQDRLREALNVFSRDPVLWRAMAETRFLQAAGAQVTTISPELLQASVAASREAEALDPQDAEAPGRLAQALALTADKAQAAAALQRSFQHRALDPAAGPWRVETAALVWPTLNTQAQQAALAEACIVARTGGANQAEVQRAVASNPAMAAALATTTRETICAPETLLQSPNN